MRKIAIFLAAISVLLVLAGCTANEPTIVETRPTESIENTFEPAETGNSSLVEEEPDAMSQFEKYLGNYLDSSHYRADNQGLIHLKNEYKVYGFDDLPADGYIVIDGQTKVTTGKSTLNELLLQGWGMKSELTDDSKIGAHIQSGSHSLVRDGHEIRVGLLNSTDEELHLKDASVSYLTLEQYDYRRDSENRIASAADFSIDGKLDQNSNMHEIFSAYGEPTTVEIVVNDSYAYMRIEYNGLKFEVAINGSKIYCVAWY